MKLLNDWPKKLLAICIAFVIWFYVFQTGKTKRVYAVTIEVRNSPAHLISTDNFRNVVKVEVEGEKSLLANFNPQNIQCILDLSKAKKGRYKYLVRLNQIFITTGINVKITDPYIEIGFEEIISKKIKIMARTEGVITNGFILKDIEINPQEVSILGPESIVNNINKVYTQTIDINGKFTTFDVDVMLDKLHEKVQIKEISVVNVKITITPQLRGRIFTKIPIKVYGLPQRYKIDTGELILDEIELKGSLVILQNLDKSEINPFIVVTNIRTDIETEVKVHIAPISGLTIIDFKPKIIKIKILEK